MTPYYEEPNATIYQGHALDILRGMPAGSVDCVITSPPYWGLRVYKTEPGEWGDWRGELGLEPTIELYVSHLLRVFEEVKRVLKKTGTVWVSIGDSYASGKGTCFNPGGGKGSFSGHGDRKDAGAYPLDRGNISMLKAEGLLPKSLCLIPERFALGMVDRGWILRNVVIWYKSNPMPESVKDRFTGTYEYIYFFTKAQRYWFEQQLEKADYDGRHDTMMKGSPKYSEEIMPNAKPNTVALRGHERWPNIIDGVQARNKRDVWEINTQPYPGPHFAVFPEKLVETPILAGCPLQICMRCGKAREKSYRVEDSTRTRKVGEGQDTAIGTKGRAGELKVRDEGYTDCGCNAGFEAGVVLDPFAGSGTTGTVAKRLGRKYIGIELSEKYCKLHKKRLQAVPLAMGLV